MKTPQLCPECPKHKIQSHLFSSEINDNLTVDCECPNGHKFTCYLMMPKFDMLFTFGFLSIIDGNKRAAILNFASSLEEFNKLLIRFFLNENNERKEQIDKLFKERCYIKLSERITGAFISLHYSQFNEIPVVLKSNKIGLRQLIR